MKKLFIIFMFLVVTLIPVLALADLLPYPSPNPNPTPPCSTLYWLDNTHKNCGVQRQFCGAFMYLGLKTFNNQQDCLTAANLRTSYDFGTMTLRNGSRGDAVKELQRFLNQTLNLGLVIDGKLGPKTVAVIKQWQRDNGLVSDGLVGKNTKAKMNATVQ